MKYIKLDIVFCKFFVIEGVNNRNECIKNN